jgi:hypothetical protein
MMRPICRTAHEPYPPAEQHGYESPGRRTRRKTKWAGPAQVSRGWKRHRAWGNAGANPDRVRALSARAVRKAGLRRDPQAPLAP